MIHEIIRSNQSDRYQVAGALPNHEAMRSHHRIAILTDGYSTPFLAKTAISMLRYRRDDIVSVIDKPEAGKTAQELLGAGGDIPVVADIADAAAPDALYIGIAPPGGKLPPPWREIILASLHRNLDVVSGLHDFLTDDDEYLLGALDGDLFALSALDIAAHDLHGKRIGMATWEDAVFRVDANCAWTAEQTIANSHVLADLGVESIEQPLPIKATRRDKQRVFEESALPIIADEDCQQARDVESCEGFYHGANVKICKCGGLTPARSRLHLARGMNMKTMVGCMVESSIGISAAAQLLPLLDYADLDGAVLLGDEPARGVTISKGAIHRSDLFGCGAEFIRERVEKFRVS